jgi:hypothetical protein
MSPDSRDGRAGWQGDDMAKRRKAKPKSESFDESIARQRTELLENIRPYLIELPTDCDGLVVILNTDGQTYAVTSEVFDGNDQAAIYVRRATSAIKAIDKILAGDDRTDEAKVTLGIRLAQLDLEPLAIRAKRTSQQNADKGRLSSPFAKVENGWETVRQFILNRPKGVSELEQCKQASTHLKKGTLPNLSAKIEITADALSKRLRNERAMARKR